VPKHFTDYEIVGLSPRLVDMLDKARELSGVPFVITSGARNEAQNANAQGVKNSAHTRGLAVDLACSDASARFHMLAALFEVGFARVGIYDKHVHVDCDLSLPQDVAWWGTSH